MTKLSTGLTLIFDCCRLSLKKDNDVVSLFSSLLSNQSAVLNSSIWSLLYHLSTIQALNKPATDSTDAPGCNTHHFFCQHNSSQQSRSSSSGTAPTARSLAAGAFVPQFPSEPALSPNNLSPLSTAEATSPSSDSAFPEHAVTPSPEETTTRAATPNSPYDHHIGESSNDHGRSRSVPDGNSTGMAIGICVGILVLSLSAAVLLTKHVKVSVVLLGAVTFHLPCCRVSEY